MIWLRNRLCLPFWLIALWTNLSAFGVAQAGDMPESSEQNQPTVAISDQQIEEGKAFFKQGESLFAQKKYESALKAFSQAYQVLDGHPHKFVVLYNMAKCHEKLERFESAAVFYRRYLAEAGPDAQDRAEVEKALETLDAKAQQISRLFADAKSHVELGESFYRAKDFNAALAEFEKAYELLEGHPNRFLILYNIGKCYQQNFRYDLALQAYTRYLKQAGAGAEDREQVEATLGALEGLLGRLEITTNVSAEVWLGNRMVGRTPGPVFIPGGRHMLELRAKGYEAIKVEIQITARESQKHAFVLDPLVDFDGLDPAYFWTGAALSAIALGTGVSFGIQVISKDEQGRGQAPEISKDELSAEIDDLALTADILYGTAALFAVGTLLLYFLTDWSDSEEKNAHHAKSRTVIRPRLSDDSFALSLIGAL